MEWLSESYYMPINQETRESLTKWYGEDISSKITHAEAFEICEYGSIPNEVRIKQLFPMLGD